MSVGAIFKSWPRVALTLVPLLFALLHAMEAQPLRLVQQLDDVIYDARLRATMPQTLDDRIVIVDIDEKSLAAVGRWPWPRDKVARMIDALFDEQKIAVAAFDVVFAEPDESSGLRRLEDLSKGALKDDANFVEKFGELAPKLDYDGQFAQSLKNRAVVMGYYFTSDRDGRTSGVIPAPVMDAAALKGRPIRFTSWNGYGSNLARFASAAPLGGFFNPIVDGDGMVRAVPLLVEYKGGYYESLALAVYRLTQGMPQVLPGFPPERFLGRSYQHLESVKLRRDGKDFQALPVDRRVATLVPFRGQGGEAGGSFRYVSASDIIEGKLTPGQLQGRVVFVGTTAPGLQDLRVTPVSQVYPGVEIHANLLSGLLDDRLPVVPDYAMGYDVLMLLAVGLLLAFVLPAVTAPIAVLVCVGVLAALSGLNWWLYESQGLVMPLAASVLLVLAAFALNMSYGYFVESRSKRSLARLFGTYVPPALVEEMVKRPESYSMEAKNKELTVMFCDMRGFTKLSERMDPVALQGLLNNLFSRLTQVIDSNMGTTDKFMGDCVMAFWGAPVDQPDHAALACRAARQMLDAIHEVNADHRARGLPEVGVGIGLNTGSMCVGNMGSDSRRAYTVIGDSVNLGARLEGLTRFYDVDIVASEQTRRAAPDLPWQELDRVRVKGKQQAVSIYTLREGDAAKAGDELKLWGAFLKAFRAQDWDQAELHLFNLKRMAPENGLYQLFSQRVIDMREAPLDLSWDGATNFDSK